MDGDRISDELLAERKVEIIVKKNGRKVIVEKSAAEGLPEGWIKKLVISNRSGRKRRDPFFIDPQSEYIFPSFKAASRYVVTGDIGHYARKFKESDNEDDDDSENAKNVLLLESADALLDKEKNIDINSKRRRNSSSSGEHSENCKVNSDLSSVTSQVLEDLGKKKDLIENQPIAKRVTRSQTKANETEEDVLRSASSQSPEKRSVSVKEEDVRDSSEKQIMRNKAIVKKNELANGVPRRASKRLAGIELEPTPELVTRTKPQRVAPPDDDNGTAGKCKQPVNPIATTSGLKKMDTPLTKDVTRSCNTEHSSPKPNAAAVSTSRNHMSAELGMQIGKMGKPVDKKKMKMPLTTSEAELNPVFCLDGYKQKEEMSPVSPLSRKTCATKREKTAAGKRFGSKGNKVTSPKATYDNGNVTQMRNKLSNNLFESSVVRGTSSEVMEMNNNNNTFSSSSAAFDSTLADLWKDPCIAFAIKTLTGDTLHLPNNTAAISSDPNTNHAKQKGATFLPETPTVSTESPGMDMWKDPCIDFAIKTLTGAIPITGSNEPVVKPKPKETMTMTASARQEQEESSKQSSSCDYLVQQCSNKTKNNTMGKPGDLRFPQSFSKD
ncbi:Methyl-CpG-binding domain-containing protein 13 [Raphanus sativus]|uniref:Methyl-CpG-binding domain-containing protein 13 n=1 Tax=Raphanus sativus TaxID=3726 RepID=A0A6J0LDF3_RAPSA|nr:methyl-CpG-binding domain-containing protein 13 [Raphanus sativus]XP_056851092.1 methyl-CpG-binding domain-containing protein 13 [Raphanus sativus]KAJ4875770.1 Methyl-CpG-binding domain-containing protein 13 [Raphanus sativus]